MSFSTHWLQCNPDAQDLRRRVAIKRICTQETQRGKGTGLYRMDRVRSQVHNSGKQIEISTGLNKSAPIDYEDAVIMFILTEGHKL
jgi:hypothetical protein